MKQYEEANRYAKDIYSTKFPLPGLKNKLKKAGAWKEPKPASGPPKVTQKQVEASGADSIDVTD